MHSEDASTPGADVGHVEQLEQALDACRPRRTGRAAPGRPTSAPSRPAPGLEREPRRRPARASAPSRSSSTGHDLVAGRARRPPIAASAEASETSCSDERPPWRTATLSGVRAWGSAIGVGSGVGHLEAADGDRHPRARARPCSPASGSCATTIAVLVGGVDVGRRRTRTWKPASSSAPRGVVLLRVEHVGHLRPPPARWRRRACTVLPGFDLRAAPRDPARAPCRARRPRPRARSPTRRGRRCWSAASASARACPTTSGTAHLLRPRDTTSVTVEPLRTLVPSGGDVSITRSFAHGVGVLGAAARSGSPPRAAGRSPRRRSGPARVGIGASPGPLDTVIVTSEPLVRLGAAGRVAARRRGPRATSSDWIGTTVDLEARAAAASPSRSGVRSPTTFGTCFWSGVSSRYAPTAIATSASTASAISATRRQLRSSSRLELGDRVVGDHAALAPARARR